MVIPRHVRGMFPHLSKMEKKMSEQPQISEEALRRARVYWEQAQQDRKTAKQKLRAGAFLDSSFLGLQAALNGLSAVCGLQGHFQLPAASPLEMLELCREAHPAFEALREPCQALEETAGRNPFAPQPSEKESRQACRETLKNSEQVLAALRDYLKANRKRFFAP